MILTVFKCKFWILSSNRKWIKNLVHISETNDSEITYFCMLFHFFGKVKFAHSNCYIQMLGRSSRLDQNLIRNNELNQTDLDPLINFLTTLTYLKSLNLNKGPDRSRIRNPVDFQNEGPKKSLFPITCSIFFLQRQYSPFEGFKFEFWSLIRGRIENLIEFLKSGTQKIHVPISCFMYSAKSIYRL